MKKVLLMIIFALAFFLRIYRLGSYPVGFLWDEAALGYNAYSILETGRDEYGRWFPLVFKSFGDYKPGLYVYLTVPSILIFGLNEFAIRLPSAIFGCLTVLIFYLLVKESLDKRFSRIDKQIFADFIPIVCALLLAISPWHIVFSRGAWELNVMLFEFVAGFYFLVKYLNTTKKKFLYLSGLFLISALFTYQSAKFLLPVLILGFFFFFKDEWVKTKKKTFVVFLGIIAVIFLLFNLFTILAGKGGRIKAMSLFSYPRSPQDSAMFLNQDGGNQFVYEMFHGQPVFFLRSFLGRYFNHFSGKFLFISGDWSNQRNGVIYQGQMYFFDIFFLLFGLGWLFAKKRSPIDNFMLFWLFVAPIPSALTRDSISSVRSFTMIIPLIYVAAVGVVNAFGVLQGVSLSIQGDSLPVPDKRNVIFRNFCYLLFAICYLLLFVRFLDLYFVHDPKFTSENRLFGYKEAMEYVKQASKDRNKIIFTSKYGQPYIFYLFYSKYNPVNYQRQAVLRENPSGDVGEVEKIDNIVFRKIYFPDDRSNQNSLFVGDEFDLPTKDIVGQDEITLLKEIKFLNGKTAFRMVETK